MNHGFLIPLNQFILKFHPIDIFWVRNAHENYSKFHTYKKEEGKCGIVLLNITYGVHGGNCKQWQVSHI